MTSSIAVVACGASPPQPAPEPTPAPAIAPSIDAGVTPAPSPAVAPPPAVTFENLIVAGALSPDEVTRRLAPLAPALACLATSGPITTELSLLVAGDTLGFRSAWQDGVPTAPACVQPIFPGDPIEPGAPWTSVYVVVKVAPPDTTAPAAPAPPERRADFERMFCELDRLAGADKVEVGARGQAMQRWAREHVRHPATFELARQISEQHPAETARFAQRALRAEGIAKCRMQRW